MFCFQCEQTDRTGQTPGCAGARGNCGKTPVTADLQDLLVHAVKGIAQYASRARVLGAGDDDAARFVLFSMFTTLTNVNFTPTRFVSLLREAEGVRNRVRERYEEAARARGLVPEALSGPATWSPEPDLDGMLRQAAEVGVRAGLDVVGPDVVGLRALCLYGLKGVCAYAHHATVLGLHDPKVYAEVEDLLSFLADNPTDPDQLLERALRVGMLNLDVMRLLDAANTGTFGSPQPTAVRTTPVAGKAILVSGHDLKDLAALLEQTAGTGINVYTHGEMLPAHGYPALRAHEHLVGNYGGAWHEQQVEFARFPGPILMTSNCIIEPHLSYRHRIFTTGPVGWPGVRHLTEDFRPVIQAAMAMPGFAETEEPERAITVGFARDAVLSVTDRIVDAVRQGAVRHFFLIGGCDGPTPGRNYFTDLALSAPQDSVILTLGCNKYRFNDHDFGSIGGIPRLLDLGQCNDTYSAITIALRLAKEFGCDVNELPLTLALSWMEQKAVAVLLSLLALGIRNIHLGPDLPGFLTPNLVARIVDEFGLRTVGDPAEDIATALGRR
ncbi:hydroxylamine reductase precursor (EC 1.7.99.1) [Streptoalloteichus tenebrarius]|uniref:Hydroxylamine reductase n=1 Tax=Streptoalloteichus tenebrarius (strain ATCC 17920 / DSM 40477 / JCM 4838 / CBS 697.72 / NBRC 16177 / NCIMB 11028 / NRRL B-12390 / A12253. 1 / ISP 5477) TaxID=1933 RepID=A0ABT1HRW5_STRSD|nr:hydroxylamine reductase [Streptoalloteichus tenebrarius]MCP2258232.1 hydroxylamine reductase precursor (EC 1.7.99.1) [Streptoalloteichus tenebrarius]BFF04538.1 hydroxylamine reductase [Streptoalloteichus tenebrarius]